MAMAMAGGLNYTCRRDLCSPAIIHHSILWLRPRYKAPAQILIKCHTYSGIFVRLFHSHTAAAGPSRREVEAATRVTEAPAAAFAAFAAELAVMTHRTAPGDRTAPHCTAPRLSAPHGARTGSGGRAGGSRGKESEDEEDDEERSGSSLRTGGRKKR